MNKNLEMEILNSVMKKSTKKEVLDRIDFLSDEIAKEELDQITPDNLRRIGFEEEMRKNLSTMEMEIVDPLTLHLILNDLYEIRFDIGIAVFHIYSGNCNPRPLYFNSVTEIQTFINHFQKPKEEKR